MSLIKCTRRGEFLLSLFVYSIIATLTADRYVEILERQQVWLVRGLRELYRRTIESGVWPGDQLELETNGHLLTHDLLARLGVLDQTKGFCFEEDTQSLCSRDPDDARDSPRLLQTRSSSSLDSSVHQHMPTASRAGEHMNAGSEDNIEPQLGNYGLVFTPRSVKGADSSPTSLDVRQHRQQQWVGADVDSVFHESNLLISADQTSFALECLITAASSSDTPVPLTSASPASLPEPGKGPECAPNFDLAGFGAPPGFWKTYAV